MRQDSRGTSSSSDLLDGSRLSPSSIKLDVGLRLPEELFHNPLDFQCSIRRRSGTTYTASIAVKYRLNRAPSRQMGYPVPSVYVNALGYVQKSAIRPAAGSMWRWDTRTWQTRTRTNATLVHSARRVCGQLAPEA